MNEFIHWIAKTDEDIKTLTMRHDEAAKMQAAFWNGLDHLERQVRELKAAPVSSKGGPCTTCKHRWAGLWAKDVCWRLSHLLHIEGKWFPCTAVGGGCWAWEEKTSGS